MKVAFTGHRPNKLGGYKEPNPMRDWLALRIRQELSRLSPELVISGMALGVDQWAAQVAVELGIPFIAAVPFEGQESMWPEASQQVYWRLLEFAKEVVFVGNRGYSPQKMQQRNEYMVDRCDVLLAVWDGTPGGTGNCVKYAKRHNKRMVHINPQDYLKQEDWFGL